MPLTFVDIKGEGILDVPILSEDEIQLKIKDFNLPLHFVNTWIIKPQWMGATISELDVKNPGFILRYRLPAGSILVVTGEDEPANCDNDGSALYMYIGRHMRSLSVRWL